MGNSSDLGYLADAIMFTPLLLGLLLRLLGFRKAGKFFVVFGCFTALPAVAGLFTIVLYYIL